jgi:uncharacterized protein (TIGR02145 family)
MKNVMKKQCKKSFLWGFKGILSVALSSLGVIAFAQGAEVCQGSGYTIADAIPASAGSEYRWLENGNALAGTNQATYNVPANKAAGVYTYVRQSKSAECPDWQSSNEFTVTVFTCSFTASTTTGSTATFTDPRDGKQYKTVVMPDGRTWFAQNLNYTKDLTFNQYAFEANGKRFNPSDNGILAIGSYWCPAISNATYSGDQNTCNIYGALYTWETAMMVDGKYADETRTSSAWDESWVSSYYYTSGAPGSTPNADRNNARGGTNIKGGGRGICPLGWHIPTLNEWAVLLDNVEGNTTFTINQTGPGCWGSNAGIKLKSSATYTDIDPGEGSWVNATNSGTDDFGFAVLPGGDVRPSSLTYHARGTCALIWTSAVGSSNNAVYKQFNASAACALTYISSRWYGENVRCIMD